MQYDDLPDKQQKFIDLYLEKGDRDEAYHLAGYSIEGRAWKANARNLFLKLTRIIDERLVLKVDEGALVALDIIKKMMQDEGTPPPTRLKCAQDYLTRAGRDNKGNELKKETKEAELTDKELDQEIMQLQGISSAGKSLH